MAKDEREIEDEVPPQQTEDRSAELKDKAGVRKDCLDLYKDIEKGFTSQWERANSQMDYWDIYHCELGAKQFYSGTSKIFVPIVHDAINARKTRFVNQMFPNSGRHVEVIASEDEPSALTSLLEFYIRKTKLRTRVMPALMRNGDVEGQYSLALSWIRNERHVASRVRRAPTVDKELPIEGEDEFDDIEEETIVHQYPGVEVIADADLLVLPFTADSIEGALDAGGSVTIIRRWSKAKIRQMIRDKEIDKDEGQALIKAMTEKARNNTPDKKKKMASAAGIQMGQGGQVAQVCETWTKLKIDDERRICRVYFGGEEQILSARRNPYWCDKVPILSGPVEKEDGSFKGISKVKYVESLQYQANDAVNEGMDSAAYALMPIVMTDPQKNPRVGSMVLSMAAIWQTDPQSTQFAKFPELWKDALGIVSSCKDQILQTLGVNPAMMPQQTAGKKQNQAQIAMEQQVDLLTTADAVTSVEGEILTPLLQWFLYLDHQFRDEAMTIRAFGEMGVKAEMERIEPVQMDRRFEFRWYGVEAARSVQMLQQSMATLNVLKGIPPQMIPGKQLDLSPVIAQIVENTWGVRTGAMVFKDIRKSLTLEPDFENKILSSGMPLPVHPMDDDAAHLQAHMQAFQESGDVSGVMRDHMMQHAMQMQQKQQAAMAQQQQILQQGQGGAPGGGGPPRQGAKPMGPRPQGQGPAGMIHQDRMQGAAPRLRAM